MIEWIIIVGLVVAMYIVIHKYEKKMDMLELSPNLLKQPKKLFKPLDYFVPH